MDVSKFTESLIFCYTITQAIMVYCGWEFDGPLCKIPYCPNYRIIRSNTLITKPCSPQHPLSTHCLGSPTTTISTSRILQPQDLIRDGTVKITRPSTCNRMWIPHSTIKVSLSGPALHTFHKHCKAEMRVKRAAGLRFSHDPLTESSGTNIADRLCTAWPLSRK